MNREPSEHGWHGFDAAVTWLPDFVGTSLNSTPNPVVTCMAGFGSSWLLVLL
jgi:hypothetical protein